MATVTRERKDDIVKLLTTLATPCGSSYSEHDWHKCQRCLVIEELGHRRGLVFDLLREGAAALASPPAEDENALRAAWEAGFRLCRRYGDNHHHWDGEQRERRWREYLARAAQAPPASDPPSMPEPSPARAGYPYTDAGDRVMAERFPASDPPGLREALDAVLASAHPHPEHNPAMIGAWARAREVLAACPLPASPQAETMPAIQVGDVVRVADSVAVIGSTNAASFWGRQVLDAIYRDPLWRRPASPQAKDTP